MACSLRRVQATRCVQPVDPAVGPLSFTFYFIFLPLSCWFSFHQCLFPPLLTFWSREDRTTTIGPMTSIQTHQFRFCNWWAKTIRRKADKVKSSVLFSFRSCIGSYVTMKTNRTNEKTSAQLRRLFINLTGCLAGSNAQAFPLFWNGKQQKRIWGSQRECNKRRRRSRREEDPVCLYTGAWRSEAWFKYGAKGERLELLSLHSKRNLSLACRCLLYDGGARDPAELGRIKWTRDAIGARITSSRVPCVIQTHRMLSFVTNGYINLWPDREMDVRVIFSFPSNLLYVISCIFVLFLYPSARPTSLNHAVPERAES